MNWLHAIIICVILSSIGGILQRLFLIKNGNLSIAFSLFFQLFMSISLFLINLIFVKEKILLPYGLLPNFVLAVLLYSFGNICVFISLKEIQASKFTIIFASRALFSVIGFIIVIGQPFELKLLLGGCLIIIGIIFANISGIKFTFGKGELLALLAGLAFGIANVNDKILLSNMHLYPFLILAFILEFLFSSLIYYKSVLQIPQLFSKERLKILTPFLILSVFGTITFFWALQKAPESSSVILINLTYVLLTVVLGIIFLKEKSGILWKISGAIFALLGLILVS